MESVSSALLVSVQTPIRRRPSVLRIFRSLALEFVAAACSVTAVLCLIFFPWSSDSPLNETERMELQKYYATAYATVQSPAAGEKEDSSYVRIAREMAEHQGIKGKVETFARTYNMLDKKVLDIGAGRGYLQDVVEDYTALDISPSARRFFHKPFVLGSATFMPFPDNSFDGAWSIWVLEHVPNPEAALAEMRRVLKHGGLLYLFPTWDCTPWAADGYEVRPYRHFSWTGKLIKASIPFQLHFWGMSRVPVQALRLAAWKVAGAPTKFRYRRLTPNYDRYWVPDSDAVNSLSRYETMLWFRSRGDECLSCAGELEQVRQVDSESPLVIRIRK